MNNPLDDALAGAGACHSFPLGDLRFALEWSRLAPGFGGWQVAFTEIASGEMVDVTPPGAEAPVFCILPRPDCVELIRERPAEAGGGHVTAATLPTLRHALLLLCPLGTEALAEVETSLLAEPVTAWR